MIIRNLIRIRRGSEIIVPLKRSIKSFRKHGLEEMRPRTIWTLAGKYDFRTSQKEAFRSTIGIECCSSIRTPNASTIRPFSSKQKKKCEEVKKMVECRGQSKLDHCLLDGDVIDFSICRPKVTIIGAGIAGLSAANRLVSCGINDVTILESLPRPGGRILSCWMDESVVELGAQWIEGACPVNPIFNLACKEGLLREPLLKQRVDEALMASSRGLPLSLIVNATAKHSFNFIDEQAADVYSRPKEESTTESKSAADLRTFMMDRIPQEIQIYPTEYRTDAAKALFGMLNELRVKIGDDLQKVSLYQYGSSSSLTGGNIKIDNGLVGLLAPLIRDLPDCNIVYCKPVEKISWSKNGVTIRSCDGDSFDTDYCIVTLPLGVLKAKHKKIFSPKLPSEKVEAIEKLGWGHVNTVYFAYSRPFWVWQEGTLRLAWSMEEMNERTNWTKSMGPIEEMPNSCQILMCNVGGEEAAKEIEELPESKLAEDITRICRQFLNDPTIPYPTNVMKSKWSSNPNFLGAKSYLAVGSTVVNQNSLGAPIPEVGGETAPRLLFAGEATCPGFHATLQGARMSGLREAQRIINLTKKFGGPPPKDNELCNV